MRTIKNNIHKRFSSLLFNNRGGLYSHTNYTVQYAKMLHIMAKLSLVTLTQQNNKKKKSIKTAVFCPPFSVLNQEIRV